MVILEIICTFVAVMLACLGIVFIEKDIKKESSTAKNDRSTDVLNKSEPRGRKTQDDERSSQLEEQNFVSRINRSALGDRNRIERRKVRRDYRAIRSRNS